MATVVNKAGQIAGFDDTLPDTDAPLAQTVITQIIALTQAEYDALTTKDALALYVIVEA